MIKQLCGKKRSETSGIRSTDGKLLIEKGKIVNRWQERFREQKQQKGVQTRLTQI